MAGSDDPRGLAPPRPRGTWPVAGIALLALALFSGCDSTQSKNARAELQAKRELAARELPSVRRADPRVRVERVALVRGKGGTGAIVVDLRSRAVKPLTDVPIAVGLRGRDGRARVLNAKRNLDWFQTHVPAIPPHGAVTWVFKGARGIEPGERPFAKVGVARRPALSTASSLPEIAATAELAAASSRPAKGGKRAKRPAAPQAATATVVVENGSDVPQYDLQVYAVAERGGDYVAAGKARVEHLGTGKSKTVAIQLAGAPRGRGLRAVAIPTTFD